MSKKDNAKKVNAPEKPKPFYLSDDYPFKAIGNELGANDVLEENSLYEIKCPACEASLRTQGVNVKETYNRLAKGQGCLCCGNKELVIKKIDTSAAGDIEGKN